MSATNIAVLRRRRRRSKQEGPSPRTKMLLALGILLGTFVIAVGSVVGGTGLYAMSRYDEIASGVVPPEELIALYPRGGARIYDRHGEVLYEFVDELSGLRRPVGLDQISERVINATIAVEDPTFYENNGVNVRGLMRAGVENFAPFLVGDGGEFLQGSGGSSITQQLAKNVYIPREERTERSVDRKIKETVIAMELTERYSKDQILEWYLNSISYGGIYTGIEAAAEGYFGKTAAELSLAEASLLAGIPQSPALYDPFSPTNIDATTGELSETSLAKARQGEVLRLMTQRGYITQEESEAALAAPLAFSQRRFDIEAPHFVLGRIAEEITERFGDRALYDQGLEVTTSLDLNLQHMAEEILEAQITENGEVANLYNGAFVAIDPYTGEILTYVGSRDYFRDDIEGRNDNAVALNSPGSTLKPFTFMTTFMNGWGTGTAILDTPFKIVDFSTGEEFAPRDPIATLIGPMTAASALGNSLNITAIKAILYAGVDNTIATLKRVGYTTFDNPGGYGPALTTGGAEITLLDQVYAYSTLASNGVMRGQEAIATSRLDPGERTLEPIAILRVTDPEGRILHQVDEVEEQQVVPAEYSYLVTSILSDGTNQCITYGVCGALALPNGHPSGAKTGTSEPFDDSRDIGETWTVGYTPNLVAGTWAGNADNSRISGITSTSVSLRAWKEFMVQAIEYLELPPTPFERPAGVVSREVCWPSGKLPTPACPNMNRYTSLYAAEVLPGENPSEDEQARMFDTWWQQISIDTRTGLRADDSTPSSFVDRQLRLVLPQDEVKDWAGLYTWAAAAGVASMIAPTTEANAGTLPARITSPDANDTVDGTVAIRGRASSPDMRRFYVEWGRGENPSSWIRINTATRPVTNGVLGSWDTTQVPDGTYTLRVIVEDEKLGNRQYAIPIEVENDGEGSNVDEAPFVSITSPADGAVVDGTLSVQGTAASANTLRVRVEYGAGPSPGDWTTIETSDESIDGILARWDTTQVENGAYTIRVVVVDEFYGEASASRLVVVQNEGD